MERPPDAEGDLVAENEILEHHRAPKIDVPVLKPKLLRRVRAVLRKKRGGFGASEELDSRRHDLDLARRDFTVDLFRPPQRDFALDLDDVLRPRIGGAHDGLLARSDPFEEHLDEPAPVAHVQEDELSQVAPPADPSAQEHLLPRIRRGKNARRLALHRSLAAPRRSAISERGKVSCSPVARRLTVTAPAARSRSPTKTASIEFRSNPRTSASSKSALARASPFLSPRATRSTSTHPPGSAARISRSMRDASATSSPL